MAAVHPQGDEGRRLVAAVAAAPRDAELRRALAASLARAGEPRAALEQYRSVLGLKPNDPDAAADMGLMALRCRAEKEVLGPVRSAAGANPGHARLWQVLGLVHRALDELAPAMAAFDRAAALAPQDRLIAHGRARAWFDAGKPAVDLFERARRLTPDDESVFIGLMAALVAAGRSEEAVTAAQGALRRNPDWVVVHATLASHLWAMGAREGFTASFEAALRASPRNILLWKELVSTLIHAGRYEAALEAIGRGRAVAGPHLVFDANEAICRAELGDAAAADRLYERLAEVNDPVLTVRHVRHLLRSGRPEEAERIGLPLTRTPAAKDVWPYLSLAWRLTANPAWEWLEGDPRLVGTYELAEAIPSLEALAASLRALHLTTHQPLIQSVRGGTQTDGML
ncbi:MAG TPA: hypothetical protein VN231_06570, partial [Allosphingosinicella sp.]|nr:hypothetical protein [Allosphingosinicella sp.]